MAGHLTDLQKRKIVADYIMRDGNASETARKNGVSDTTVLRVIGQEREIKDKLEQKRAQNAASVERYMAENSGRVCDIIDHGLELIAERLGECTPVQTATIMGILIDKHKGVNTQRVELASSGMSLEDKLNAIKEAAQKYAGDDGA